MIERDKTMRVEPSTGWREESSSWVDQPVPAGERRAEPPPHTAIRFYCGLSERTWNGAPVQPGPYACIAPVYGKTERTKAWTSVHVPEGVQVLQDSGAFSDGPAHRLSFAAALERQIAHAERYRYTAQIEAMASYDCLLIDEIWEHGMRRKARWPEEAGEVAVQTSVEAARFLSAHRQGVPLVLSAQGVSPAQYLRCAEQLVPLLQSGDRFGCGGWCILGKLPARMMPLFRETMQQLIPFLGREGVRQVHIWGVCYPPALGELLWLCDQQGITLSTDSAGPTINPCYGSWGYGSWRDNTYQRLPSRQRGEERARHVRLTHDWLADFRRREAACYRFVPIRQPGAYQQSWLEEGDTCGHTVL